MNPFFKKNFTVNFQGHKLAGDVLSQYSTTFVLMLHGGGNATRLRFESLRQGMAAYGISSCSFDFIGRGDSSGDMSETSLENRSRQAALVIETLKLKPPLSVIGASMGAHTAIMLLRTYPIDHLILFVPAIYSQKAYRVRFNSEFTKIIRTPGSWEDSDAWQLLADYSGCLFMVTAEADSVIPKGISEKIYDIAKSARERTHWVIPKATHQIFAHFQTDGSEDFDRVINKVVRLLASK